MQRRLLLLFVFAGAFLAVGTAAHAASSRLSVQDRIAMHQQQVRAQIECTRAEVRGGTCTMPVTSSAPASTQAASPPASTSSRPATTRTKRIEVSIDEQRLRAYEGEQVILDTKVSTGRPGHETPRGTFEIGIKQHNLWSTYGAYLPYAMQVNGPIFLHGIPVRKDGTEIATPFGRPVSMGCIRVPNHLAARLYDWAPPGTTVIVH